MPTITTVILLLLVLFSIIPLRKSENRTFWGFTRAVGTTAGFVFVYMAVTAFQLNVLAGMAIMVVILFLVERSMYTKAGLITTGILGLTMGSAVYYMLKEDTAYVEQYLENNSSSLYYAVNEEVLIDHQSNQQRPLASTVKKTIAGVFAEEVTSGNIDPQVLIDTAELEPYFLPETDGGGHEDWLADIEADEVPLEEVVRSMISFSSNANTDFLMEYIGIGFINERIKTWGLKDHDPLLPLVSSLLTVDRFEGDISSLADEEFRKEVLSVHQEIVSGELNASEESVSLSVDEQRPWSNRLPGSTTKTYSSWMLDVQSGEWSDPQTSEYSC